MARRKAPGDPPKCTAILLCERTIYNAETEKNSVIEILDYPDGETPGLRAHRAGAS